jgi:hypothetical protein
MAKPNPENVSKYESLVLAVATGVSIADWCRKTRTNRSTASKWQMEPEFDQAVNAMRRRLLNEAIGKFTGAVCRVADGMVELAERATSEPTKLAAQKAVLENLVEMTEFAEVKKRLDTLEEWRRETQR